MDNETYCPDCGSLDEECNCNIELEELGNGTFRFEFQHEGCSYYGTKFKKNYADRDE